MSMAYVHLLSHVQFKKLPRPTFCHIFSFLLSLGTISHVNFKKRACRPVEFKGQEPHYIFCCIHLFLHEGPRSNRLCPKIATAD